MRVLAEFVDVRNGKRYSRGDGDKINPALEPEQVERLKKAGCLGDGAEAKASTAGAGEKPDETKLEDLTVQELRDLAEEQGIDLGDATKKADIIAAIELHRDAK